MAQQVRIAPSQLVDPSASPLDKGPLVCDSSRLGIGWAPLPSPSAARAESPSAARAESSSRRLPWRNARLSPHQNATRTMHPAGVPDLAGRGPRCRRDELTDWKLCVPPCGSVGKRPAISVLRGGRGPGGGVCRREDGAAEGGELRGGPQPSRSPAPRQASHANQNLNSCHERWIRAHPPRVNGLGRRAVWAAEECRHRPVDRTQRTGQSRRWAEEGWSRWRQRSSG